MIVAIIAVAFSTKDFVDARRNPLLATRFEEVEKVRLPVLSVCSSQLDIGGFGVLGRGDDAGRFEGMPLFSVRSVESLENGSKVFWPGSLDGGNGSGEKVVVRGAYRGMRGVECAGRFGSLDVGRSREDKATSLAREDLKDACQFCYQIGRDPPLFFEKKKRKTRSQVNPFFSPTGFKVHFVTSPFYRTCLDFDDQFRSGDDHWDFMRVEIKRKAKELEKKGILNFNDAIKDFNDKESLDFVMIAKEGDPLFEKLFENPDIPEILDEEKMFASARDMMCHVYFWSGFFYPSSTKDIDIRYKFNKATRVWERVGKKGSYLRDSRNETDLIGPIALAQQGKDRAARPLEVYQEDFEDIDDEKIIVGRKEIIGTRALHRVQEGAELIATVEGMTQADISFKLQKIDGKLRFIPSTNLIEVGVAAGRVIYDSHLINFRIDSFESETITKTDSTSLMQYLVDAIGYISMALGFTVYSLLIGPTNLFFLGVERPKRKTNGDRTNAGGKDSGEDEGDGTTEVIQDTAGPSGATRGGGVSSEGLRLRFGIQRHHFTGPMEPLQRIA